MFGSKLPKMISTKLCSEDGYNFIAFSSCSLMKSVGFHRTRLSFHCFFLNI